MDAMISRLLEVRQENDRLTVLRGGDPDRKPWTVYERGRVVSIFNEGRERFRVKGGKVLVRECGRWVVRWDSLADCLRFWVKQNQTARRNGHVEYAERQRLDALCAAHWDTFDPEPCWAEFRSFARAGLTIRFRPATSAADRREVAELRRRLAEIPTL